MSEPTTKHLWTPEEARAAQLKGIENKRLNHPNFAAKRLLRVRKQLDRLDEMMLTESNPQKLDRVASAMARVSEVERQLAGRPMPGSLRPRQPKEGRRGGKSDLSDV